ATDVPCSQQLPPLQQQRPQVDYQSGVPSEQDLGLLRLTDDHITTMNVAPTDRRKKMRELALEISIRVLLFGVFV
ncbi:unnamed protein product, partial [Lampetra planeri]